jgi:hypothetical protein
MAKRFDVTPLPKEPNEAQASSQVVTTEAGDTLVFEPLHRTPYLDLEDGWGAHYVRPPGPPEITWDGEVVAELYKASGMRCVLVRNYRRREEG